MKKHFNNKGYMLVEIILASVIAMIIAYFVIELTIKLKNRNDDLLVKTLVSTDQAIIYNTIMKDINSSDAVDCDYIENKMSIDKNKNTFTYGDYTNVVSEYATIGDVSCDDSGGNVKLNIPINVKQLPNDYFGIKIRQELKIQDVPDDETPDVPDDETPDVPDDEIPDYPEDRIRLVSCRGAANEHYFFKNGNSVDPGCCAYVGLYGTVNDNYVVRYTFNTGETQGASSVKVIFRPAVAFYDTNVPSGKNYDRLRFYIEEVSSSDGSYKNANGSFNYSGKLEVKGESVYSGYSDMNNNTGVLYSKLEGTADIRIKPNTTYYLWVFSDGGAPGVWRWDIGSFDAFADIVLNPANGSSYVGTQCCWSDSTKWFYTCG